MTLIGVYVIMCILSWWTKPHHLLIHKTKGTFWTVAEEWMFFEQRCSPLDVYIYEEVIQTRWGKWKRTKNYDIQTDGRFQYATDNFEVYEVKCDFFRIFSNRN